MCEPGDDIHDVSREAKDMEGLQGMPDRRHSNGGWKQTMALLSALVVGMILPNIIGLTSGTAVSNTKADHNSTEIESLKQRTYVLEQEVAKGGRWTSKEQMEFAEAQAEKITKLQISDAAIVQELKGIRLILAEIRLTVQEIDRRTR